MARYAHARNTFQFGEVSPASFGRADLNQYRQMCEKIKNMVPRSLGGAGRRMGTKVIGTHGSSPPWADAQINDLSTVDALKLVPYSVTNAPIGYSNYGFLLLTLDYIKWIDIDGLTSVRLVNPNTLARTYGLSNDWSPSVSGTQNEARNVEWAQYGDLVVAANGQYPPLYVYPTSAGFEYFLHGDGRLVADNSLSTANRHSLYPFESTNTSAVTFTIDNASIGTLRTITASTGTFTSAMVGRYIRVYDTGVIGLAVITAYISSTQVTVTVIQTFPGVAAYTTWAFSYWGGDRGWPKAVAFFEERIFFAGCAGFPDYVWGSQVGDLYELSLVDPTATPGLSDAFAVGIGQNDSSSINFLFPRENLFAVTKEKESFLASIDDQIAIGNGNTRGSTNSFRGGKQYQPAGMNNAMLYSGENGGIWELLFNFRERGYLVSNLAKLAADITRDRAISPSIARIPFVSLAAQKGMDTVLWSIDSSGRLYSLTRDIETETVAWAHHALGGEYLSGEAQILDICVVNNKLCMAVVREVGLETERISYEIMADEFVGSSVEASQGSLFLDCCKVSSGVAGAVASGFQHLANATDVSVVADGEYLGEFSVNGSGQITLPTTGYTECLAGFLYDSILIPSALETNALFGSGLGSPKRTDEAIVLFERTVAAELGTVGREDIAEEVQFRESSVPASDPIPLFSGEKYIKLGADYDKRQLIYVKQSKPYPMTVNAIIAKGILYD